MRLRRTKSTTGLREVEGEAEPFLDGWRRGQVWGTMWHGALENDDFRRPGWPRSPRLLDRPGVPILTHRRIGMRRETMINTLADAVEQHVDLGLLLAGTRVAGRL